MCGVNAGKHLIIKSEITYIPDFILLQDGLPGPPLRLFYRNLHENLGRGSKGEQDLSPAYGKACGVSFGMCPDTVTLS